MKNAVTLAIFLVFLALAVLFGIAELGVRKLLGWEDYDMGDNDESETFAV